MNKKQNLMLLGLAVIVFLTVNIVVAPFIFTILLPTIGVTSTVKVTVTWSDGSAINQTNPIDWGVVDNNTATNLTSLIKITNVGNRPATLALSAVNLVNITWLDLSWNYTGAVLAPSNSVLVQLTQNVTASAVPFGYDTRIDATG